MRVAPSLSFLSILVLLDLIVASSFGSFNAGIGGSGTALGLLAITWLNSAATWVFVLSLAFLIAHLAFVRSQGSLRLAAGMLLFAGILAFLAYLGFSWGFIVFNGFSPSWDAVWFLSANIARLPQHLLQTTFLLTLLVSASLIILALVLLFCLRRLAQQAPGRRAPRMALAGIAAGLAVALATASGTTANITAVAFTRSTLDKALRISQGYAGNVDPAALLRPKQRYAPADAAQIRSGPVIVLLVEALRRDLLLMSPSPAPFLASLRAEALWFDKAYATASHSNYADLAFWYSQYPLRDLDFFWRGFPRDAPWRGESLFSAAKKHGFATAYISSQDENWGQMINWLDVEGEVDFFFHAPDHKGSATDDSVSSKDSAGRSIGTAGKLEDSVTLDVALEWIRSRRGNKRFVLGINLQNTHFSYVVPPGGEAPYQPADLSLNAVYYKWPEADKEKMKNRYLNAVWNLDRLIAGFVAALKREGLWQDCVFLVVGDSGEAFYEHGFGNHSGPMYDEVMRTLALLKPPVGSRLSPGVYDPPLSHIDFAPTVLELLGMTVPDSFQGRSLSSEPPRHRLFMHTNAAVKQHGVVEWPWKLLHTYYPYERFELYQLEADPDERRDLLRAEPEKSKALRRTLETWTRRQLLYYGDPEAHRRFAPPRALDLAEQPAAGE